jgi:hypothetical protein
MGLSVVQGKPFCQVSPSTSGPQSVRDDDPAVPLAKGAKICTASARQLGEKDDQAVQRNRKIVGKIRTWGTAGAFA